MYKIFILKDGKLSPNYFEVNDIKSGRVEINGKMYNKQFQIESERSMGLWHSNS